MKHGTIMLSGLRHMRVCCVALLRHVAVLRCRETVYVVKRWTYIVASVPDGTGLVFMRRVRLVLGQCSGKVADYGPATFCNKS